MRFKFNANDMMDDIFPKGDEQTLNQDNSFLFDIKKIALLRFGGPFLEVIKR